MNDESEKRFRSKDSNLTKIGVIESKWEKRSNASVRDLFDLVAEQNFGNRNEYHYEMAMSPAAMEEAIPRLAADNRVRWLYLATHGDKRGIQLGNNCNIKAARLVELIEDIDATPNLKIHGIFFGACEFGGSRIAAKILEASGGITWTAGYITKVDWIESSVLDLLFFNLMIRKRCGEPRKQPLTNERELVREVARALRHLAPGLIDDLGFGIYVRKKGGGIENLVAPETEEEDEA